MSASANVTKAQGPITRLIELLKGKKPKASR
jgi:hypothetical protein